MAVRVISTKLALDGESEYRAALKNINADLRLHQSELDKVEAKYRDNANSLEALTAKGDVLQKEYNAQAQKLQILSAALEKANQANRLYSYQVEQSSSKLEKAKAKLDELKNSTGNTQKQEAALTAEIAKHNKALEQAQISQQKANNTVTDYQKKVNYAERDLTDLNAAISKNTKYQDEARASTDKSATSIDQYGKEVKQTQGAVETLASALATAGVAYGIREITGAIKDCIDASVAFESAITGVYKTVDGTPEQLAAISDGIKEMSTQIPATTTEIAAVAEAAGQLGIATDDVLNFSRVMIDLGESTNLSADEAASALAKFANITGTSADDYSRLGSTIVGLGNNFATTEADITDMATKLASAGTLAGLTEPQVMALATAMSSVGIEAEAGGTAMTQTLTAIEKSVATGGDSLNEFARISGMSAGEFSKAWKTDAISAVEAFIKGLGALDGQGESATLVLDELGLTGIRQSNMLKSLALASDTLTGAVALANQAWSENTALTDEANKRYETTESKMKIMGNAFQNVKAAIGDALSPAIKDVAEAGTGALGVAETVIEKAPWLVQALTGVFTGVTVLTAGVAGYNAIVKYGGVVTKAFNLALNQCPAIFVAAAITGLVVAVGAFVASAHEASEENRDLVDSLEESRKAYQDTQESLAKNKKDTAAMVSAVAELADTEHKTIAQKETLLSLVQQLNDAVPGLNLAYDQQTGSLNMTAAAIRDLALAQAEQEERSAAVDRLSELYVEQSEIANDLAAANDRLSESEGKRNKMIQDGSYWMSSGYELASQNIDDAVTSAARSVKELTKEQEANTAAIADAEGVYGDLTSKTETLAEASGDAADQMSDLTGGAKDLADQSRDLADAQDTLTSALKEQKESGSLSLDTTLDLIDAGYAAALSINDQTHAITLNKDAYIQITKAKLDDQIASLETQKLSVSNALAMKDEALMALDLGKSYLSAASAREALEGQEKSYSAQIAALEKLKGSLNSYSYASASAAKTTSATSKKAQTQAEKDLAKFKAVKATLDHQKAMDELDEKQYYAKLAQYRDQYLTSKDSLDDYRKITEEIYKYDKSLAEDENKLWEEQTENLIDTLDDRLKEVTGKQDEMSDKLSDYGDLFEVKDNQMSLNNLQDQIDAMDEYADILDRLKEARANDGLLSEVTSMDIDDAIDYGKRLLGMSPEQFEGYNTLWEEKQRKAIEISAKFYSDELKTIEEEYNGKLKESLDKLKGTAYSSGENTVQSLIDGFAAKEQALYAKAKAVSDEVSRILAAGGASGKEGVDGSHAGGLPYVPFDGYVAELHKGERVLTAEEAKAYIAKAMPSSFDIPSPKKQDTGAMLATAVNAFGTMVGGAGTASGDLTIEIPINGEKFYRATIKDFRRVSKANPEVSLA